MSPSYMEIFRLLTAKQKGDPLGQLPLVVEPPPPQHMGSDGDKWSRQWAWWTATVLAASSRPGQASVANLLSGFFGLINSNPVYLLLYRTYFSSWWA
jgi:hypothetical protein